MWVPPVVGEVKVAVAFELNTNNLLDIANKETFAAERKNQQKGQKEREKRT